MADLPKTMKALRYSKPKEYAIVEVPIPTLRDNDVLIKVKACGVCGTDLHIHDGEFIARFPLIPGHETVGVVAGMGKYVKDFKIGELLSPTTPSFAWNASIVVVGSSCSAKISMLMG